jgi:hypothetical protein
MKSNIQTDDFGEELGCNVHDIVSLLVFVFLHADEYGFELSSSTIKTTKEKCSSIHHRHHHTA